VAALASRPQGEWHDVAVTLDEPAATGPVAVTIYADRGVVGRFEHDESDPTGSADRPYTSAGVLVSGRVDLE